MCGEGATAEMKTIIILEIRISVYGIIEHQCKMRVVNIFLIILFMLISTCQLFDVNKHDLARILKDFNRYNSGIL